MTYSHIANYLIISNSISIYRQSLAKDSPAYERSVKSFFLSGWAGVSCPSHIATHCSNPHALAQQA